MTAFSPRPLPARRQGRHPPGGSLSYFYIRAPASPLADRGSPSDTRSATPPTPPLAIVGIGCLFPGSGDFAEFWSRVVGRFDAIREVPPTHWRAEDYFDPDPKAPDRVYAARGGFLDP